MLILVILFAALAVTILMGTASPLVSHLQMARELLSSKKSYYAAEAGAEDAFYRTKNNISISYPSYVSIDGAEATVSSSGGDIISQGIFDNDFRSVLIRLLFIPSEEEEEEGSWVLKAWMEI
ncbi:MAG: hypothetical protein AAB758_00815 [Patescibacteria group bacterium]